MKNNRIFEFRKTDHFLLQQWQRGIDDYIIRRVLSYVLVNNDQKTFIIASPQFLKEKVKLNKLDSLIVVIKGKVLITTYWAVDPEYLYKKEKNVELIFLQNQI
jgi:hypothetical protein